MKKLTNDTSEVSKKRKRVKVSATVKENSKAIPEDLSDNIDEKEQKSDINVENSKDSDNKIKKFKPSEKRKDNNHISFGRIIKIIIIVIAIAGVSAITSNVLYQFGVYIASQREIITKTQEINITASGTLCYEQYDKGVIVANSGTITKFSADFEQEWEIQGNDGSPIIDTCGKYALVSYRDTTNAKFINDSKPISITTSGKIITSTINKNGYFALVMQEIGYKSQVWVYDNEGKVFYKWHSADNRIIDVALSPDNKSMAISYIPFNSSVTECGVMIFDMSQSSPVAGHKQNDNLIMDLEYVSKNKLVAIGDSFMTFYKTNGKVIKEISYPDKEFVTFNVTDTGKTILCFSNDDTLMSDCVIFSYNENGKQIGDFETKGRVISIDSCGNKVLVVEDGKFDLLTDKLRRVRNTALVRNLENSVIFNNGKHAFLIAGNLAHIIKIN